MKLALGCDHGGFALMKEVKAHLDELGIEYVDFGTHSEESCNYPDYAEKAANAVVSGQLIGAFVKDPVSQYRRKIVCT